MFDSTVRYSTVLHSTVTIAEELVPLRAHEACGTGAGNPQSV